MKVSLLVEFKKYREPSLPGEAFLSELDNQIAQDLWKSSGGHWSTDSIDKFKKMGMQKLASGLKGDSHEEYQRAWIEVVRDFHKNQWGELRLIKKEPKPETEERRIFWELFSYIFALIQATLITKTAVFYFGIKSAEEGSDEGKVYVFLAIAFSFISLTLFALRKSRKSK
jgi:hypothetical protein